MSVDLAAPLDITLRLIVIGVALTSIELIVDRRAFAPTGPFSANVVAIVEGTPVWLLGGPAMVTGFATLQLVAASILLVTGPLTVTGRIALVTVATTFLLLRWRRGLGGDGAEQLTAIVVIAAVAAFAPTSSEARVTLAVIFIVAQTSVAYVTSGIAKLVSPIWRNGSALPGIFATHYHGHPWAAKLLARHPRLGTGLGWGIMLLWVLFPVLLLFGSYPMALAAAIAGLVFHVTSAILMGLNNFMWAFPSTYPCFFALRSYF